IGLDTYAAYMEGQDQDYESEINTVLFDASGNPNGVTTSVVGKNTTPSRYKYLGSQWQTYNFVGQADYDNTFEKSNIKASLIAAVNQSVNPGQYNTYNRLRLAAYMHYGYDDKYFVDGVFTVNGSNLLPESNRYGYFPSLSAGWIASNEAFLKDVKAVNLLKIRASAGITGNDMLPSGAHNLETQYFGGKGGAIFGDSYSGYGGLGELRLQSSNLTYEKTYKYNVGVDASLLNMFDVTVDVFMHKTRDILVNTSGTTSAVLGLTPDYYNLDQFLPYENIGAVDNKGIELGLNFHKTINELTMSAGGNFTFTRNKIIEMGEGYYPNEAAKQTGKSVGQPIGYQVLGLFKDAAEIAGSPTQILYPVVPGDFKYANTYGNDAVVDSYDRVALGYSTLIPEINYSFNVGAEYKGFGIDAMFQGVGNYSAYLLNNSQYKPLVNNGNLSQLYYENRWTAENPDAKYPRLTMNTNDNNYVVNSTWIADASFLKLRHCEVYYKMPQSWLSSIKLEAVKLYLRGTDLLTIDKIKDVDPESFRTSSLYPSISSINIGAKIDF
ncbi:MAG: SusC/RagA family TonB-linked outer membrane protein, partial [Dysgonomonas sp.]